MIALTSLWPFVEEKVVARTRALAMPVSVRMGGQEVTVTNVS